MNKHLPPQVRVFSCVKVNGGFQAREACSWRSYEYILPLELLSEADNMVLFLFCEIAIFEHSFTKCLVFKVPGSSKRPFGDKGVRIAAAVLEEVRRRLHQLP